MIAFWIICSLMTLVILGFVCKPLLSAKKMLILVLLNVPVFTFVTYSYFGASKEIARADEMKIKMAQVQKQIKQLGSRDNIVDMMEKRMQKSPDDAKGWYLLGKLYMGSGEQDKALAALERAHRLKPDGLEITVSLASVLFIKNGQQFNSEIRDLLKVILSTDPQNTDALNLVALDAYNKKEYQLAVKYWEQLIPLYEGDSNQAKALLKMIAKAQKLGQLNNTQENN